MIKSKKHNLLLKRLSRYSVHILLLLEENSDKITLDRCFKEKTEIKNQLTKNAGKYEN